MKVISLTYNETQSSFSGYFADDFVDYFRFQVDDDDVLSRLVEFDFEIRSYEHFAGVMGKFNPWARFLRDPIEILELTFDELQRAHPKLPL